MYKHLSLKSVSTLLIYRTDLVNLLTAAPMAENFWQHQEIIFLLSPTLVTYRLWRDVESFPQQQFSNLTLH